MSTSKRVPVLKTSAFANNQNCKRPFVKFSIYDLAQPTPPTEPSEDMQSFINRMTATSSAASAAAATAAVPRRATPPAPPREVPSSQTVKTISTLEKTLNQERQFSDALRQRVADLETSAVRTTRPAAAEPLVHLPLPVPSTSSEWRQKLEQIQKKQLERMIGRSGVNIPL
jgi:hypothetical protein